MNEDKKKVLDEIIKLCEKNHGAGCATTLDSKSPFDENNIIHTGSISLDTALGIGGYPRGRIIEVMGPEMAGKSTLSLEAIAQEQSSGGLCAFVDTENALDVVYASNIGVDTSMLLLSQPDFGEQALEIVHTMAQSGKISLIIVDSVAALIPQSELEGTMSDSSIGTHARLMSKAMRKLTPVLRDTNCTLIFTNQIRNKIGVMYGSSETTTGGNALKFYASIRLDIRRRKQIKDGEEIIGNETEIKVIKNKVASPFKPAQFNILYGEGIDTISDIMDAAIEDNIIVQSGAWFSYEGEKIGQGKATAIAWINEGERLTEIRDKTLKGRGLA